MKYRGLSNGMIDCGDKDRYVVFPGRPTARVTALPYPDAVFVLSQRTDRIMNILSVSQSVCLSVSLSAMRQQEE